MDTVKPEKWLRDGKTIYSLHSTGKFNKKGEPELCNKFYFSVQPDYGRGITNEMAEEQAKFILSALNNNNALIETLTKTLQIIQEELPIGSDKKLYTVFQEYQKAIELLDKINLVV